VGERAGPDGDRRWPLLQRVIEAQSDAICLYDVATLRILACNPAWSGRHGLTIAEAVGHRLDALLVGPELAGLHQQLAHLGPDEDHGGTVIERALADGGVEAVEWVDRWLPGGPRGQILSVGRDITAMRQAEAALAASEARGRRLTEMLPAGIVELGRDFVVQAVNPAWTALTGRTLMVGESGRRLFERVHPDDAARVHELLQRTRAGSVPTAATTFRWIGPDHQPVWIELRAVPTAEGGVLCAAVDRTGEHAERRRADRLARSLDSSPDAALVLDGSGIVEYVNAAATRLGFRVNEPFSAAIDRLAPDAETAVRAVLGGVMVAESTGQWQGEIVLRPAPGVEVPLSLACTTSYRDGEVEFVAVLTRDLSDERLIQARLAHAATHDPLTGLVNRRGLDVVLAQHEAVPVGLLVIDLDGFKRVNDTFGHDAGDRVLMVTAQRLLAATRVTVDTVARLGGDEFVVACPRLPAEALAGLAARITDLLASPVPVPGGRARVGASIGLTVRGAGESVGAALRRADLAMYASKREGGGARWDDAAPAPVGGAPRVPERHPA
jgi:diguanylate cyclase (GGDEF)-like protein/PAS domain S-box-containing protein